MNPTALLYGLEETLLVTFVSFVIGAVLGLGLALLRMSGRPWIRSPAAIFISTVLSVPLLVQLFLFYYTLPILTGVRLSGTVTIVVTLSTTFTVFTAEMYRSGLQAVPGGQRDAAVVLGLSRISALRYVVLPQAVRLVVPPLTSSTLILVKASSLATFIGVNDLLNVGRQAAVATFQPVAVLSTVALIYFALCYPIAIGSVRLERRWSRGTRRAL